MKTHGGKRDGAGRKPSPFFQTTERLAFKDEAERGQYMELSTRERVTLALSASNLKQEENVGMYATVKHDSKWIYAGHSFPIIESIDNYFDKENPTYRLSLEGSVFQKERGWSSTCIPMNDLCDISTTPPSKNAPIVSRLHEDETDGRRDGGE